MINVTAHVQIFLTAAIGYEYRCCLNQRLCRCLDLFYLDLQAVWGPDILVNIKVQSKPLQYCNSVKINDSQLAKMKKSIPDVFLPWNLYGWSSWSKKLEIYFKNYDFCEYVKFGAISWKFDILSITA